MKKALLLSFLIIYGISTFAQKGFDQIKNPRVFESAEATYERAAKDQPVVPMAFTPPTNLAQIPTAKSGRYMDETHVITTEYDLQTNGNLCMRVFAWPDGSAAAVSTMGFDPIAGNRGAGYNYYDGTSWGPLPTQRVEPVYSGWPSIFPYGENGEALISHGGTPFGINMYVRETKGEGDWVTHHNFPNPAGYELTWPKVAVTGENNEYIHIIASDQDGAGKGWSFYTRSTDGGETWSEWSDVPLVPSEDYFDEIFSDDVISASNGNTVAFMFLNKWYDIFYIKSDDNGETWEKNIIFEHPHPSAVEDFETAIFDTTYMTGGSGHLAIDSDGIVHAVWSIMRYRKDEVGTTFSWFPFVNGIAYWNETMGDLPEHPNGPLYTLEPQHLYDHGLLVGWTPDLDGDGTVTFEQYPAASDVVSYRADGLAAWPTISIEQESNTIAIFFSTVDELRWNDIFYYRSIFATYKDGIYGTWYMIEDHLMENFIHLFDEGIYSTAAANAYNGQFFMYYNADPTQGTHIGPATPDHAMQENYIYAVKVEAYVTGLQDFTNPINNISAAYPNPVSGESFNIDVNLSKPVNKAHVSIHNIAGQLVQQIDLGRLTTGMNQIKVNVDNFQSGVYFYTVSVDDYKETKKVVIR